jgi:hypothetical protein
MNEMRMGHLLGFEMTVAPSAAAGSALLGVSLAIAARRYARLPLLAAAGIGLAGTALHWLSDTAHQLGHAQAARTTGYPMAGIRYHTVFATSLYPPDEPTLPPAIHVRRALGGMPVNLALGALAALVTAGLRKRRNAAGFLAWEFCVDNLLVLGLGALAPLGFTDGSTLLEWVPKLRRR